MHGHLHKAIEITKNQGKMTPPKEYSKLPGIDTKETEVHEFPDKDFKTNVKMLRELLKSTDKQFNKLGK